MCARYRHGLQASQGPALAPVGQRSYQRGRIPTGDLVEEVPALVITLAIPFPQIDPVLVQFGPLAIRWYALAYIVGILLGWRLAKVVAARPGWAITQEQVDDLLFYATLGIVLGGRLGFVLFYHPGYYLQNPLEILAVWQGGMSFHGGLLGVIVAIGIFARIHNLAWLEVLDLAAVVTPVGLFFGRVANFINAELWGRVTDVPWAFVFPGGGPEPRHPSQLYEAFLEGLVLFAILWFVARRADLPAQRGLLGGIFILGYAIARSLVELVREPDAHLGLLWGTVTMGQLLSLPMFLLGIFLVSRAILARPASG